MADGRVGILTSEVLILWSVTLGFCSRVLRGFRLLRWLKPPDTNTIRMALMDAIMIPTLASNDVQKKTHTVSFENGILARLMVIVITLRHKIEAIESFWPMLSWIRHRRAKGTETTKDLGECNLYSKVVTYSGRLLRCQARYPPSNLPTLLAKY